MKQYYVKRGEATSGPFRAKKLKKAARLGKLLRDDLLGYTLEGPWRKAETISVLPFPDNVDEPFVTAETTSLAAPLEKVLTLETIDASPVTGDALSSTEDDSSNADPLGPISADPLNLKETKQRRDEAEQYAQQSTTSVTSVASQVLSICGWLFLLYSLYSCLRFVIGGREDDYLAEMIFSFLGVCLIAGGHILQGRERTSRAKTRLAESQSRRASRTGPAVSFDFHVNEMTIAHIDINQTGIWGGKPYKAYPFCFAENRDTAMSIVFPDPKFPSEDWSQEEIRLVKGENHKAVIAKIRIPNKGQPRVIVDAGEKVIGTCALTGSRIYATWLVKDRRGNSFLCEERNTSFVRLFKILTFASEFAKMCPGPLTITRNGLPVGDVKKNTGKKRLRRKLAIVDFNEITKEMDFRLLVCLLILHHNSSESPVDP